MYNGGIKQIDIVTNNTTVTINKNFKFNPDRTEYNYKEAIQRIMNLSNDTLEAINITKEINILNTGSYEILSGYDLSDYEERDNKGYGRIKILIPYPYYTYYVGANLVTPNINLYTITGLNENSLTEDGLIVRAYVEVNDITQESYNVNSSIYFVTGTVSKTLTFKIPE